MTQRLPQRTMDSTRPSPGIVSPRAAIRIPSGPSRTAVPSRTSTTVQPGIVAGLVSGAATRGCRIAIAAAEGPALAWETGPAPGVHRPATGRMAWECFRQWRANPTPTPSFERLQSCRLIVLRKFAARAFLSAQRPQDRARLRTAANSGRRPIPVQSLPPPLQRPAQRRVPDRQMAPAPPILRRDRISGNSTGSRVAPATGRQPHSPTKCSQRYSARGLAWRDPHFGEPMMFL